MGMMPPSVYKSRICPNTNLLLNSFHLLVGGIPPPSLAGRPMTFGPPGMPGMPPPGMVPPGFPGAPPMGFPPGMPAPPG
jgi:hypothetical protein